MSRRKCCLSNCRQSHKDNVSLFAFPISEERRNLRMKFCDGCVEENAHGPNGVVVNPGSKDKRGCECVSGVDPLLPDSPVKFHFNCKQENHKCLDENDKVKSLNEKWNQTKGGIVQECVCRHPLWNINSEHPPSVECLLHGCVNQKVYVAPGESDKRGCKCVEGPEPGLADKGTLYHWECNGKPGTTNECLDDNNKVRKLDEVWNETHSNGVGHECRCERHVEISEDTPPDVICRPRGCVETYDDVDGQANFVSPGGKNKRGCICVPGTHPDLMDAITLYHFQCDGCYNEDTADAPFVLIGEENKRGCVCVRGVDPNLKNDRALFHFKCDVCADKEEKKLFVLPGKTNKRGCVCVPNSIPPDLSHGAGPFYLHCSGNSLSSAFIIVVAAFVLGEIVTGSF